MSYSLVGSLDQGTTSSRFILFRARTGGQIEYSAQMEHKQIYPQAGWVEHDPMEILNNSLACIEECFEHVDDISKVCICVIVSRWLYVLVCVLMCDGGFTFVYMHVRVCFEFHTRAHMRKCMN